jgi:hypothetical protein
MTYDILILGASYGSLLGTKLTAAGHNATLVCRAETAELINAKGTEVRIKLRGEDDHHSFFSRDLAGKTDAVTPENADPTKYDMICLAMQEPQYSHPSLKDLLTRIAQSKRPCMSIMNMPPLPYLKRIASLEGSDFNNAFLEPDIWERFDPSCVTLCSPDPQAFRPPDELPNVLHVGLPTNFKVSKFHDPAPDAMLDALAADIEAFKLDGKDVPVKLRVYDSLFVPFAKWAMLATGNYRCVTEGEPQSIRDAVHGDLAASEQVYDFVTNMVIRLGADPGDMVPFAKYAKAAENLLKPSSAARAIAAGAKNIERVDKLMEITATSLGLENTQISKSVAIVDGKLAANRAT